MNICLCGAQAGYQHDPLCPFPYYGNDPIRLDEWREQYNDAYAAMVNAPEPVAVNEEEQ